MILITFVTVGHEYIYIGCIYISSANNDAANIIIISGGYTTFMFYHFIGI